MANTFDEEAHSHAGPGRDGRDYPEETEEERLASEAEKRRDREQDSIRKIYSERHPTVSKLENMGTFTSVGSVILAIPVLIGGCIYDISRPEGNFGFTKYSTLTLTAVLATGILTNRICNKAYKKFEAKVRQNPVEYGFTPEAQD